MAHIHDPYLTSLVSEVRGLDLRLRPWDADSDTDVETWLRGALDPEFRRWNTPVKPVTDAESARETLRLRAREADEGRCAAFRITAAGSDTTLGHIGVNAVNHALKVARIGYWVLPEARGRGVATRALRLAADWAFGELGLQRLELDHAVGHKVSCRIAERCGFRYEGTLRGAVFEAGRLDAFRDAHLHARLSTDPDPAG